MKYTGERMLEGCSSRAEWVSHQSRYRFAGALVAGKDILDVACGSGYGSMILAEAGARSVLGVDVSAETVAFAQERYRHGGLRFCQGDAEECLLVGESFDVITSFETIEHLNSPDALLANISRLLRPNGVALISTPNLDALFGERTSFSEYHTHEFHSQEFDDLLRSHFGSVEYYWQRWPLDLPELRRAAYNAMEGGGLAWAKRLLPKRLKRVLSACLSAMMSPGMSERKLGPLPWSTLADPHDACILVAAVRHDADVALASNSAVAGVGR